MDQMLTSRVFHRVSAFLALTDQKEDPRNRASPDREGAG
jgi:hypothetical protein